MKVLYLNTLYAPIYGGGAEITLKTLVEGVRDAGNEVVVLTLSEEDGVSVDMVDGVKVIRAHLENNYWHQYKNKPAAIQRFKWHLKDINNLYMANIVKNVLKEETPDVVSCHNLIGWSSSVWNEISSAGIPIVQVLHDLYNICPNSTMFKNNSSCEKQCLKCKLFRLNHAKRSDVVSAVVGVSDFILKKHLDLGLFNKAMIKTSIHNVRNYVDRPVPSKEFNIKRKITFGYIGALKKAKGVDYLIEQFSMLESGSSELIVAGSGNEEYVQYLQSISSRDIRFLGQVKQDDFFPKIDVLVVPSLWEEPLGMVVAEAFIYGIPVIASMRGGIPEMVNHNVNGILFEPTHKDELAATMSKVIENPIIISCLAEEAQRESFKFLAVDEWVSKYVDLYNQLVRNK